MMDDAMDEAPHIVHTARGRAVGYRRVGQGPPVALLHASPRSAAALLPLARLLAERFTVFAFDTPGFGFSAPLPGNALDAWDYGHALIEAFDALGIAAAPVYGSHTGAAIAVAAALSHPTRVTALALDGYAMFTPTEQAEYLAHYLAPIVPDWDGMWLAWLWGRVRDQFTFFPWYLRAQHARIQRPLPPPAMLQTVVVDFLAAGDNYRMPYAAAFAFDGRLSALQALTVPCVVMAREDDLLVEHLTPLVNLPPHVTTQRLPAETHAWQSAVAKALSAGTSGTAPASPQPFHDAGDPATTVVRVALGTIGVLRCGPPATQALVVLPGIPGSARACAPLARALEQPVLVIDLPGFGASLLSGNPDAPRIAAAISAALQSLGVSCAGVIACGESAAIAAHLAGDAKLVLIDPVADADRAAVASAMVDVTPRDDGAHLLAAWHQLREMALWRPWFQRTPAHAIDAGHAPDVARLALILTDWMRGGTQGKSTLQAALGPALAELRRPDATISGTDWRHCGQQIQAILRG